MLQLMLQSFVKSLSIGKLESVQESRPYRHYIPSTDVRIPSKKNTAC